MSVDQQPLCLLYAVTRTQVASCCSHLKELPQTLTSAPYCPSWRRCSWWRQERCEAHHQYSVLADSLSYLPSLNGLMVKSICAISSLSNWLSSLSVRSWCGMAMVEPAWLCCCPCTGHSMAVCSRGSTCSSQEEPPLLPIWTWLETFYWNVRYSEDFCLTPVTLS